MQRQEKRLNNVKEFIANSAEFKEMERLYNNMQQTDKDNMHSLFEELQRATTFKQILKLTDKLDFEKQAETDESVKFFGATGMKFAIVGLSLVSNQAAMINQLRLLRDKVITTVRNEEALEARLTRQLVEQSNAVKRMREMTLRATGSNQTQMQDTLDKIERANAFAELLAATDNMNIEQRMEHDPTARYFGVTGIKTIMWAASLATDQAGFPYYLRLLREETISKMAAEGFYSIHSNNTDHITHVYSPPDYNYN